VLPEAGAHRRYANRENYFDGKQLLVEGHVNTEFGKVKYVKNCYDEDYVQTLGVNFLEKTIELKNALVTFSIWDLGGVSEEFANQTQVLHIVDDTVTIRIKGVSGDDASSL